MSDEARRARAEERSRTMVLRKTRTGDTGDVLDPIFGAEAISLLTQLTRSCHALPIDGSPRAARREVSVRFVPREPRR